MLVVSVLEQRHVRRGAENEADRRAWAVLRSLDLILSVVRSHQRALIVVTFTFEKNHSM